MSVKSVELFNKAASDYKNRKYDVVPYDSKWKDGFVKETDILKSIFGKDMLSVEHIGSTAIPELAGKPTIDILIR
ncbi:MAG: hypothetical protein A3D44_03900 [Candidatus Staskawiczbacteria bacterium RIFCSPHIGHO2_02_FULL_42_22]|uniref:GrpB family protein n=1 Tax=Candidatus Staskawiczbacteria bacterium RIFCSPHIGHO2_02_FULL_42_22 TaxID=1802207 RepID=A0A1G2I2E1_9BACT|nr:MAG: hypothetical protein A3D44_03900 [Candidatus Staskawiczbacteria bacterium RIFCSPHIGHO2_02_FULL_42_22]